MPPKMSIHVSPRSNVIPKASSNGSNLDGSSMNMGNKIGNRSTGRGEFAHKNEHGSSMKSLLYEASPNGIEVNPMRPTSWIHDTSPGVVLPGQPGASDQVLASQGRRGHVSLPYGTQNQNNMLGDRPVVRQSKIYRQNESGNAMKSLLGVENLAWNTDQQQGAYEGMGVYDPSGGHAGIDPRGDPRLMPEERRVPKRVAFLPVGGSPDDPEPEYPLPGCSATCDGCGDVVTWFYHCTECMDPALFDLCSDCCTAVYLPARQRAAASIRVDDAALERAIEDHPTHDILMHAMELINIA